jgi:hypothetical protein
MGYLHQAHSDKCFFQFLIAELTLVSQLESESRHAGVARRYGARLLQGRARVRAPLTPAIFHLPTYFSCTSPDSSLPCCTCFAYQLEKNKDESPEKEKKKRIWVRHFQATYVCGHRKTTMFTSIVYVIATLFRSYNSSIICRKKKKCFQKTKRPWIFAEILMNRVRWPTRRDVQISYIKPPFPSREGSFFRRKDGP